MRILVVSPHADDEVLGCGGMLLRRIAEGHSADVVVGSVSTVRAGGEVKASADTRRQELAEAARRLGVGEPRILFEDYENRLDTLPILDIVSALDAVLSEGRYDQVFIPYPSHHQDHRILYEASFSALREKGDGHGPTLVAAYEYPYVGWTPVEFHGGPYYVDVSEQMDGKIHALEAYASQLRPPPHPTSVDAVRRLASMRGLECGRVYAELFYVLKMVDR